MTPMSAAIVIGCYTPSLHASAYAHVASGDDLHAFGAILYRNDKHTDQLQNQSLISSLFYANYFASFIYDICREWLLAAKNYHTYASA